MENLKKSLKKEKTSIVKCSQCNKDLDLSIKVSYCNNCKSYYCDACLKAHNEIFIEHNVNKTNEYIDPLFDSEDKNSLLVNPYLDLDDRGFSDKDLPSVKQDEDDRYYSDLNMLFHDTLTSIQETFNEEICKLKAKNSKENKDNKENNDNENEKNNDNKIIIKENEFSFDKEKLEKLPPLKRLEKILDIFNNC